MLFIVFFFCLFCLYLDVLIPQLHSCLSPYMEKHWAQHFSILIPINIDCARAVLT